MTTLAPPANVASPFDNNHADPWAKTFVDLPSLNAGVTDAIAKAITHVRMASRKKEAELRTSSILVLGPAGAGKTHLFARLRHKLGPKAVFVHLRPLVGTEMTPRYVLGQIVQQLGYETTAVDGGLKQLEALVGSSLAHLDGESPDYPRLFLDEVARLDDEKRAEKLEGAVEQLLERHQEADETYLSRLLNAPFMKPAQQRAALAWLAGRELEELQLKRLGVSSHLPEDRVVQALQTLGLFAAPGAPIVLVFDQLENLMDAEATGARVRAYANLVAELFDTTRGLILVQMALDSEWEHSIRPQLSEAQKTRLSGQTTMISLPTPIQARDLVQRWVDLIPDRAEPFPWPFGERRVEAWTQTPGMTPRMLMIACRQALALGPNAPFEEEEVPAPATERSSTSGSGQEEEASDGAALARAWEAHVTRARAALDEAAEDRRSADVARIAGGIAGALGFAPGVETRRVDARQYLQILGKTGRGPLEIAFLHQGHPKSVSTALDRAGEAVTKAVVVVVRERAVEFPPTWKAVNANLVRIIKKGVRWLMLARDDAANLLALESFLAAARSRDLEAHSGRALELNEVREWIARTLHVDEWPVLRAALGESVEVEEAPVSSVDPARHLPPPASARAKGAAGGKPAKTAIDVPATIRTCLAQLRVASLERLLREVARVKPDATRPEVLAALEAMGADVRWFGRALVAVHEPEVRP